VLAALLAYAVSPNNCAPRGHLDEPALADEFAPVVPDVEPRQPIEGAPAGVPRTGDCASRTSRCVAIKSELGELFRMSTRKPKKHAASVHFEPEVSRASRRVLRTGLPALADQSPEVVGERSPW
jgi:hypothetical protein